MMHKDQICDDDLLTLSEAVVRLRVKRHMFFVWLRNSAFVEVIRPDGIRTLCLRASTLDRLHTLRQSGVPITPWVASDAKAP